MKRIFMCVFMLGAQLLCAMDKEREKKVEADQRWAKVLHEKTDQAVGGNLVPLQLLLANRADPNLTQGGCTPLAKVFETQQWFEQEKIPMSSKHNGAIKATIALLKKYGGQ